MCGALWSEDVCDDDAQAAQQILCLSLCLCLSLQKPRGRRVWVHIAWPARQQKLLLVRPVINKRKHPLVLFKSNMEPAPIPTSFPGQKEEEPTRLSGPSVHAQVFFQYSTTRGSL